MLAIRALGNGETPKAVHVQRPPAPTDTSVAQIKVTAAGLHRVVRGRASGQHYSASANEPNTAGVDGTGVDLGTGKPVYFTTAATGEGSFVEFVNVPSKFVWEIPEGADPVQTAALMNPLLSSWMALCKRVDFLQEGRQEPWSCLIMGATSMSGSLAIKVARHFGAARVIGAARNRSALEHLDLDAHVVLQEGTTTTDFAAAAEVDVVLDYLGGPYIRAFLLGSRSQGPLTWVSIGEVAGADAEIPSRELRRRDLTLRGAGLGSWNPRESLGEIPRMLQLLRGVRMDDVEAVPLRDVEEAWDVKGKRVVFVTGLSGSVGS